MYNTHNSVTCSSDSDFKEEEGGAVTDLEEEEECGKPAVTDFEEEDDK